MKTICIFEMQNHCIVIMLFQKSNFQLSLTQAGGAAWNGNSFLTSNGVIIDSAAPGLIFPIKMQNQLEKSTTSVNNAGALTVNARKASKPIISIESVEVNNDEVSIDYLLNNDEWISINLSLSELKQFTLNRGLNDYCFDYCNGEHVQDSGSYEINTFLTENLSDVVKTYLEEYPLESVIAKLTELSQTLAA